MLYFARDILQGYADADETAVALLENRQVGFVSGLLGLTNPEFLPSQLWFVPMVNPDGYAFNARQALRGERHQGKGHDTTIPSCHCDTAILFFCEGCVSIGGCVPKFALNPTNIVTPCHSQSYAAQE